MTDRKVLHLPNPVDRELATLSRRYEARIGQPTPVEPPPEEPALAAEVEALEMRYAERLAGPIEDEKEPLADE